MSGKGTAFLLSKTFYNKLYTEMLSQRATIAGKQSLEYLPLAVALSFSLALLTPSLTAAQTSTKFALGDRVQTTSNLNVRSAPSTSGTVLGVQASGLQGTVVGGSTFTDGFFWWQINYDAGPDGCAKRADRKG